MNRAQLDRVADARLSILDQLRQGACRASQLSGNSQYNSVALAKMQAEGQIHYNQFSKEWQIKTKEQ